MSNTTIFTDSTICKSIKVYINDIEIPQDDMKDFQYSMSLFRSSILGTLTITDSFNLLNSKQIEFNGNTTVKVVMFDFMRTHWQCKFKVVDMQIDETNPRVKAMRFKLIDSVSYTLATKFNTKSFNANPVDAFKQIIDEYKCQEDLESVGMKLDLVSAPGSENFSLPHNMSVLDFFLAKLSEYNVRVWFDHTGLHIKEYKLSDYELTKFKDKNLVYTDFLVNNEYLFKIHFYTKQNASQSSTSLVIPKQTIVKFNAKQKIEEQVDLKEIYSEMLLNNNDDFLQLQETTGDATNPTFTTKGKIKYDLFGKYMFSNVITAGVPGTIKYANPGAKVTVKLLSKSPYDEQQLSGDVTASGVYIIGAVTGRIIGDKFIQQITFNRFDNPKPRKS